jgi:hypothetical protein
LETSTSRGTTVAGATRLAAARPAINWFLPMGSTASCWGSRFSSRGKMMTGKVTQAAKNRRAAHPRYWLVAFT